MDAVAGRVQVMIAGMPPTINYIKSNRLRALTVSGARRSPVMPDLPTIAEAGVPGYDCTIWYAMLVPASTPKAIVATLNRSVARALGDADLRPKLEQQGLEVHSSTPEELARRINAEIAQWSKVIKSAGIRVE
ncbi:MAG: hypothetical protein HYY78_16805 [Betaproteobacteria bacterium]|nr:hypothetical protein [Betaproteobacteria bacterium]